jgi:type IV secretory pathway TraG/TraD family ATPase VirD4
MIVRWFCVSLLLLLMPAPLPAQSPQGGRAVDTPTDRKPRASTPHPPPVEVGTTREEWQKLKDEVRKKELNRRSSAGDGSSEREGRAADTQTPVPNSGRQSSSGSTQPPVSQRDPKIAKEWDSFESELEKARKGMDSQSNASSKGETDSARGWQALLKQPELGNRNPWDRYKELWPSVSAELMPFGGPRTLLYGLSYIFVMLFILGAFLTSWRGRVRLFVYFLLTHFAIDVLGGLALIVILKIGFMITGKLRTDTFLGIPMIAGFITSLIDTMLMFPFFFFCSRWRDPQPIRYRPIPEQRSVTHGSARWATWDELASKRWFSPSGIPLLRIYRQPDIIDVSHIRFGPIARILNRIADYLQSRFDPPPPPEAQPPDSNILHLHGEGHIMMIAPPGAGKTTGLVIPMALSWQGSLVVTDIKGEITAVAARRRRELGQQVHVIDPFNQTGLGAETAGIDLFALIHRETWVDDCKHIAALLMPLPLKNSDNATFWIMAGRNLLAGLIGYIWSSTELAASGKRNIVTLREYLGYGEDDFRTLLKGILGKLDAPSTPKATSTDDFEEVPLPSPRRTVDPFISGALESYMGLEAKVRSSVHTECRNVTDFLDSPGVKRALSVATVDLHSLRKRPQTLFLVIPDKFLQSHAGLLRLIAAAVLGAIKDCPRDPHRVLLLLDEFGNLGHMEMITKDMTLMRGYGTHICIIAQAIGQLTHIYGEEAFSMMFATSQAQIFARVADLKTAQHVSSLLGHTTVHSHNASTGSNTSESTSFSQSASSGSSGGRSQSFGSSSSHNSGSGSSDSRNSGQSANSGWNYGTSRGTTNSTSRGTSSSSGYSEQRRELMTADEILNLPPNDIIIRVQGSHPIRGRRLAYFEEPEFHGQYDPNPMYSP